MTTIFVSYCREPSDDLPAVRALVALLRSTGAQVSFDEDVQAPPENWPRWCERQLRTADLVVFVCTATMHRHFVGEGVGPRGLGIAWEGMVTMNQLYATRGRVERYAAVLLPHSDEEDVPIVLRGAAVYRLPDQHADLLARVHQVPTRAVVPEPASSAVDLHRLPLTTVDRLFGRDALVGRLVEAIEDPAISVVSLVAGGGLGKSAVTAETLRRLAPHYSGATRVFGWSFYSQGSHQTYGSSSQFLESALQFFDWRGPLPASDEQRALALAEALRSSPSLLVLDGIEPLQFPASVRDGAIRDAGLRTLLAHVARDGLLAGGLVLVSSRQPVVELASFTRHVSCTVGAIAARDGAALLHHLGVRSGLHTSPGNDELLQEASRSFGGHPLSLVLLARFLVAEHRGDVLWGLQPAARSVGEGSRHTTRILEWYDERWPADAPERALLTLVCIFDRPADLSELDLLVATTALGEPLRRGGAVTFRRARSALEQAGLLTVDHTDRFDTHPLVRSWSAEALQRQRPDELREAHGRLFDHLRRVEPPDPPRLLDVEPWIRAVHHGCLAGQHQLALDEVYYGKLLRADDERFVLRDELGAAASNLFVASCFFTGALEKPLETLSDSDQAWLISEASFTLQLLGRVEDAAVLMRINADRFERAGEHDNVARSLENLTDALTVTGRLREAEEVARRAVDNAGRSGWFFHDVIAMSRLANLRCRRGAVEEGLALFERARLRLQDEHDRPHLTSVNGYHHLSILLDIGHDIDAGAWTGLALRLSRTLLDEALALTCRARWLLATGDPVQAGALFDAAVDIVRRGQRFDYLPDILVARARAILSHWNLAGAAERALAARDLDEADEIATIGRMRLYDVDLALARAELSLLTGQREGARLSLERADALIRATDYRLRDRELQRLVAAAAA